VVARRDVSHFEDAAPERPRLLRDARADETTGNLDCFRIGWGGELAALAGPTNFRAAASAGRDFPTGSLMGMSMAITSTPGNWLISAETLGWKSASAKYPSTSNTANHPPSAPSIPKTLFPTAAPTRPSTLFMPDCWPNSSVCASSRRLRTP
jgi:hypothetical protein